MKNIKLILDTRSIKKGGVSPVKISIPHKGRTILLSTGVDVLPFQFYEGKVTHADNRNHLNAILRSRLASVDSAIMQIEQTTPLHHLSPSELRKRIERIITPQEEERLHLSSVVEHFINKREGNTQGSYSSLRKHLQGFCKEKKMRYDSIAFEDVNRRWIAEFDSWMMTQGMARNTASEYLSKLRAVFNHAINEELTNNYPFRGYRLKLERTRSRALTIDQLRKLLTAGKTPTEMKYILFFELSLLLLGMNISDIWKASPPKHGRIEYRRSKTGARYSVKVGKRAHEILKIIGHPEHLTIGSLQSQHSLAVTLNYYLEEVCKRLDDFPKVTSYYARHTWATLASHIGIPRHIIGAALGHSWTDVTGIYIGINEAQVDEANEAVEKYIYGE